MRTIAHKRIVNRPDGTTVIVRAAYNPIDFTAPQDELNMLRSIADYGAEDILDQHDGALSNYHPIRRFERDGKKWILLVHPREFAIEVELTQSQMGEIRALPPEQAWQLSRELDKKDTRYPIEVEPGSALP
jgi:hypothetical protein